MPNPYLPTFQNKRYEIGFNALDQRPQFQAAIGRCIALWSYVDEELGFLFSILMHTESETAHRVFLILRRSASVRQAIEAAAEGALTGDDLLVCRALIIEYGSLESQRNDLGHGCFGICRDDPDILFMVKVEHSVGWRADIIPKLDQGFVVGDMHQGLKEKLWVYKTADLDRLHSEMVRLWWNLFHFSNYIRNPTWPERAAEFQKLLAAPHIQERIAALK